MDQQGSKKMRILPYINDDLISSVLVNLPARKLHRFMFFCKDWLKLISGREFIKKQVKKNREPLSGFFFQETFYIAREDIERVSYISLEPVGIRTSVLQFLPEHVVPQSSCNGLLCCRSILKSRILTPPKLYVCNPLTKRWTSFEWNTCDRSSSAGLVFDPTDDRCFFGGITNFQVVAVSKATGPTGKPQFRFDIYSSVTESWRQSMETCERRHNIFKNRGVYVNRVLYWLTEGDQILMFDPENEISLLIRMPIPFAELDYSAEMCIGESNGKLHYVLLSSQGVQLWTLEDAYEPHWDTSTPVINLVDIELKNDEKYRFTLNQNLRYPGRGEHRVDLLSFKDGVLMIRYQAEFYSFDFATRRIKPLCSRSELGDNAMIAPIVIPYSMSLAPPL